MVTCASCGSDNCQKLSAAFSSGTVSSVTKFNDSKRFSYSVGHTSTALRAAPPVFEPVWLLLIVTTALVLIATFFGILLCAALIISREHWNPDVHAISYIAVGFFIPSVLAIRESRERLKKRREFPEAHKKWLNTWICYKCDFTFEPLTENQTRK